jgi:hypothetical protein
VWDVPDGPIATPSEALRESGPVLIDMLKAVTPGQGTAIWIGLLTVLTVGVRWQKADWHRSVDQLLLLALAIVFLNIRTWPARFRDPVAFAQFSMLWTLVFVITIALLLRTLKASRRPPRQDPWLPSLPETGLIAMAVLLVASNLLVGLVHPIDDSGYFISLGAQRLRETGMFPYTDPFLTGGASAAYGPVSFLAHLPFNFMVAPSALNPPVALPDMGGYRFPTSLVAKLCLLTLHGVGIAALYRIGLSVGSRAGALGLVCLYCGSPFILGVGEGIPGMASGLRTMSGLSHVSHIGPSALALAAFAALARPAASGCLLALASGFLFYPIFFAPAWCGYYFWRGRGLKSFVVGFGVTVLVVGLFTLARMDGQSWSGRLTAFVHATFGHQTAANRGDANPSAYGDSPFGFWGTHTSLRRLFHSPIAGASFTTLAFLGLAAFSASGFVLARGRTVGQLAALTGALGLAVQLWKTHAGGTYVPWYLAFVLVGLYAGRTNNEEHA